MNINQYKAIKKIKDPLLVIYRLLELNDEELRHYRLIHEWELDRIKKYNELLCESLRRK